MIQDQKYPIEETNKWVIFLKNFITKPTIKVGDYTYYADQEHAEEFENRNVVFGEIANLTIGKFCQIAQGTTFVLSDSNHQMDGFSTYPFFVFGRFNKETPTWDDYELTLPDKGDTFVDHDVWFGHKSTIMPGVKIGSGAIIATRAVVTKDVPPYCIVGGNPAKIIKQRFDDKTIERLLQIAWWDWPIETITQNIKSIVGADINKLEEVR
ncbi:MAG: Streptogramin A acetyltransferase [Chlamydiales bacterium]|nr:Streptogramin A acetyltransferase [Chlamydiales bacterium]MCH9634877.1 Streptogramin A acetyltransferase [Chlamydiales bacterium]